MSWKTVIATSLTQRRCIIENKIWCKKLWPCKCSNPNPQPKNDPLRYRELVNAHLTFEFVLVTDIFLNVRNSVHAKNEIKREKVSERVKQKDVIEQMYNEKERQMRKKHAHRNIATVYNFAAIKRK